MFSVKIAIKGVFRMNLPSIPKSFFNGDCFDAYRILGAHPWQG